MLLFTQTLPDEMQSKRLILTSFLASHAKPKKFDQKLRKAYTRATFKICSDLTV